MGGGGVPVRNLYFIDSISSMAREYCANIHDGKINAQIAEQPCNRYDSDILSINEKL